MASIFPEWATKAVLVLSSVACSLRGWQVAPQAKDFVEEGGSTERPCRIRAARYHLDLDARAP